MGAIKRGIGALFGGGQAAATSYTTVNQTTMPKPRVQRMPTESDPAVLAAQERAALGAKRRKGRRSTILTANLGAATESKSMGSSGQSLGS